MMENVEAMLCAYVEGELDEAGRAEIEKHLKENPQHRKLLADLARTRELLRELPRATAPADAGESLRGQVERSILLDSSVPADANAAARRWPHLMAVAAIVLLCAALALILCKALLPSFNSGGYQASSRKAPTTAPLTINLEAAHDETQATPETTPSGAIPGVDLDHTASGQKSITATTAPTIAGAIAQTQPVVTASTPSLMPEGAVDGKLAANAPITPDAILLVVRSDNPMACDALVAQALSAQTGVAWNMRRAGPEFDRDQSMDALALQNQQQQQQLAQNGQRQQTSNASENFLQQEPTPLQIAGHGPGNLYVADDMTPEQIQAVRKALANAPPDVHAQVLLPQERLAAKEFAFASTQPIGVAHGDKQESAAQTEPALDEKKRALTDQPTTQPVRQVLILVEDLPATLPDTRLDLPPLPSVATPATQPAAAQPLATPAATEPVAGRPVATQPSPATQP